MSQKQVTTAGGWPQMQQPTVLSCQHIWPRCWIYRQKWISHFYNHSLIWRHWTFHLSFRWTLQETTIPTFTGSTLFKVYPTTTTKATVNGTGAMSRGDTAMPRVRCGGDTGGSSKGSGWTGATIERDTITLGRSRCPQQGIQQFPTSPKRKRFSLPGVSDQEETEITSENIKSGDWQSSWARERELTKMKGKDDNRVHWKGLKEQFENLISGRLLNVITHSFAQVTI